MWVLGTELGSCKSNKLHSLHLFLMFILRKISNIMSPLIYGFLIVQVYAQTQFHFYNVNNLTIVSVYDHISSEAIPVVI